MRVDERRMEIMRILAGRRHETMGWLASELGVTIRTIWNDIAALTRDYPLETACGHGGGVKLAYGYQPHKVILSQEQQRVINKMMDRTDEYEKAILQEILTAFGTPVTKGKSSRRESVVHKHN